MWTGEWLIVRKDRFFIRLATRIMVFAVAAMAGLLVGGVAHAALDDHSTSTSLIVAPNSFPQGLPVTLVALVRPRAAAGTVQFKDGDDKIGDPVPVIPGNVTVGGQADSNAGAAFMITSTLAAGTHSLTAVFIPDDTSAYDPSTSAAESLTVTPPILSGLSLPIQSIVQSVLGGLAGNASDLGSLPQLVPSIFGSGTTGTPAPLDSAQLIQSVLSGLHW